MLYIYIITYVMCINSSLKLASLKLCHQRVNKTLKMEYHLVSETGVNYTRVLILRT